MENEINSQVVEKKKNKALPATRPEPSWGMR